MAKRTRKQPSPDATTREFEQLLKKAGSEGYVLRLYVTGSTPKSTQAIANIRALCDEYLPGRYDLEVVDIYQQPTEAFGEQIIAAPTLIKKHPQPARRMVGDLADRQRVLVGLDLQKKEASLIDGVPGSAAGKKPAANGRSIKWVEL